jgi:hypothetical protein
MAEVTPFPKVGTIFVDRRDPSRSLRLSWHPELSLFVLSVWRGEVCLASFQLMPADAARLVGEVTDVLAAGFPVDAPVNSETA